MVGTIPLVDFAWSDDLGAVYPDARYQTADDEIFAVSAPERLHSLATLGVPQTQFGIGVPLSRLEDVVLRDTPGFARDGEHGAGRASSGTRDDFMPFDAASTWPAASFDPRSRDPLRMFLGEAAYAPDERQIGADIRQRPENGSWDDNLPRIVVTPRQVDPWTVPEGRAETFPYRQGSQSYQPAAANDDRDFENDRFDLREPGSPAPHGSADLPSSMSDADPNGWTAGAQYAQHRARGGLPWLTQAQQWRIQDYARLWRELRQVDPNHPALGPYWENLNRVPTAEEIYTLNSHLARAHHEASIAATNRHSSHLVGRPIEHQNGSLPVLPAPTLGTYPAWSGTIFSEPAPSGGLTGYRAWGGLSRLERPWLTPTRPTSGSAATRDFSLPPWNFAEFVSEAYVPPGARYQIGTAAPAFGRPGGGTQIEVLDLPMVNFGPGMRLPWR